MPTERFCVVRGCEGRNSAPTWPYDTREGGNSGISTSDASFEASEYSGLGGLICCSLYPSHLCHCFLSWSCSEGAWICPEKSRRGASGPLRVLKGAFYRRLGFAAASMAHLAQLQTFGMMTRTRGKAFRSRRLGASLGLQLWCRHNPPSHPNGFDFSHWLS